MNALALLSTFNDASNGPVSNFCIKEFGQTSQHIRRISSMFLLLRFMAILMEMQNFQKEKRYIFQMKYQKIRFKTISQKMIINRI